MKKLTTMLILVLFSMSIFASSTATFTTKSATELTATGEPTGASFEFSTDGTLNSGAIQLAGKNGEKTFTLTLKGWEGNKITGLTVNARSNKSTGAGGLTLVAGTTTLASIDKSTAFNDGAWYGNWSTTEVECTISMTKDDYAIQANEDVVLTITAQANSIYIYSVKFTYEQVTTSSDPAATFTENWVLSSSDLDLNGSGSVSANKNCYVTVTDASDKTTYLRSRNNVFTLACGDDEGTSGIYLGYGNMSSKQFNVAFSGSAVGGYTDYVDVYYYDGSDVVVIGSLEVAVSVINSASNAGIISVSPTSLTFTEQTLTGDDVSEKKTITVTGTNLADDIETSVSYNGSYGDNFLLTLSPETLDAKGGEIEVEYIASAAGTYSGTITLEAFDENEDVASRTINFSVTVNQPVLVQTITVSPSTLALRVGETSILTATVAPADAANKSYQWMSEEESIATVDELTGEVTAVGVGTTTIYAIAEDAGGVTGECQVTVSAAATYTTYQQLTIPEGKYLKSATVVLAAPTAKVGAGAYATKGLTVVALASGSAESISAEEGTLTEYTLSYNSDTEDYTLKQGTTTVGYSGSSTGFGTKNPTWTLENDETGYYLINRGNTGRGILYYGGSSPAIKCYAISNLSNSNDYEPMYLYLVGTAEYESEPIEATSIELNKTDATLEIAQTLQLTATILPEGATGTIEWETSDESVAKVTSAGLVTAIAEGEATITASLGELSAECEITVNAAPVVETVDLYLIPDLWDVDDAVFGVWTWKAEQDGVGTIMTATDIEDAPYLAQVPEYDYVIFVRFPDGTTTFDWSTTIWNKIDDVPASTDGKNVFKITNWAAGEWFSTYPALEPVVTLNPTALSATLVIEDEELTGQLGTVLVTTENVSGVIDVTIEDDDAAVFDVNVNTLPQAGGNIVVSYNVIEAGEYTARLVVTYSDANDNEYSVSANLTLTVKASTKYTVSFAERKALGQPLYVVALKDGNISNAVKMTAATTSNGKSIYQAVIDDFDSFYVARMQTGTSAYHNSKVEGRTDGVTSRPAGSVFVETYYDEEEGVITSEWHTDPYWIVSFYSEDGNTLLKYQVVDEGEDATAPTAPTVEGKAFEEWSEDFTSVQSDLSVYARYTEVLNPEISAEVASIVFPEVTLTEGSASGEKYINITGTDLEEAISTTIVGANVGGVFTVNDVLLDETGGELLVEYSTNAAGSFSATVRLVSGTTTLDIPVSVVVNAPLASVLNVSVDALELSVVGDEDGIAEGVLGKVTVTAANLNEDYDIDITIKNESLDGTFSVNPEQLPETGGEITVNYTVIEAGTYTATLHIEGYNYASLESITKDVALILTVTAQEATQTLYLLPNQNWLKDDAKFAIYSESEKTSAWTWSDFMTYNETVRAYEATIPEPTTVIFVRLASSATEPNWGDRWNQTADLDGFVEQLPVFVLNEENGNWTEGKWFTNPFYYVTFYDENDNELSKQIVNNEGAADEPAVDEKVGYDFSWSAAFDEVTEDLQVKAVYTIKHFTVKWLNYDGTELLVETYDYGTMPSYTGAEPTRSADADGTTYEFTGWSPAIELVSTEAEYTAQFNAIAPEVKEMIYLIPNVWDVDGAKFGVWTWKENQEGEGTMMTLSADERTYEAEVKEYDGVIFVRLAASATEFDWGLEWNRLQSEKSVGKPVFLVTSFEGGEWHTMPFYYISFVNYDNTELQKSVVDEGETPQYVGETPVRPDADGKSYSFIGWNSEIVEAVADATYTAQFQEQDIANGIEVVNQEIRCGEEFRIFDITGKDMTRYNGQLPAGSYVVRTAQSSVKVMIN